MLVGIYFGHGLVVRVAVVVGVVRIKKKYHEIVV
jgi:hypothetical protein